MLAGIRPGPGEDSDRTLALNMQLRRMWHRVAAHRRAVWKRELSMAENTTHGLGSRLTDYGDSEFSVYLRRSFAKFMGYSGEMLSRRIVGIA